jgi:hypothetical protein
MIAPSNQHSAVETVGKSTPLTAASSTGYVVTNEMYNVLYDLYYQRCVRERIPCLVIVRNGSHCRVDLDMTCSLRELTGWGQESFLRLFGQIAVDEYYADSVYCWAARVPNRIAERLARNMLAVLEDEQASEPA